MTGDDMLARMGTRAPTEHPAWPAFVAEMRDRQYGAEPLLSAWGFFKAGWVAAAGSGR